MASLDSTSFGLKPSSLHKPVGANVRDQPSIPAFKHYFSEPVSELIASFKCFIKDRYEELRYQKVVRKANDLPRTNKILDWLCGIEIACPECSPL